ncbi:DUF262 domain-containing protein [Nocardia sp. NPDC050408]|uniref:DUF262 domain-containing protein n=1 Tax=Nocardia sp. NPDC050408 TaxID=3364319 RepID=UPI0037A4A3E2
MTEWELQVLDIEKTSYTIEEFREWESSGRLELSPSFQRGQVWRTPAKAFLIDTILRGFPIPPLHIRFTRKGSGVMLREVIDGQQRLTAVIDYLSDEFALSKPRNPSGDLPPWAGLRFGQLDPELQQRILDYSFRVEVYKGGISDKIVYEIFARINTYSIPLSDQELRNGRFFGEFKQSVYRLADEHKPVWSHLSLFTPQGFARMMDAQFVSEILTMQIGGMQDKKSSLDEMYAAYEDEWPDRERCEAEFRAVMDVIRGEFGETVKSGKFKRVPLFYTLFCVIYHRMFGMPLGPNVGSQLPSTPKSSLGEASSERLRLAMQNLSDFLEDSSSAAEAGSDIDSSGHDEDSIAQAPGLLGSFAKGSAGQTDNLHPRFLRFRSLWELARLSQA